MQLDIEDVIAGAIGSLLGRFFLLLAAIWIGCSIGALAMVTAGILGSGMRDFSAILWVPASPLLIFSSWALLNIPFLLIITLYFLRNEDAGYLAWGIIAGVESLAVMAGWAHHFCDGWTEIASAWVIWLILLASLLSGVWFIRQFFINRWAQEIAVVRAENSQRIAEQETLERLRIQREKELNPQ